MPSKPTKFGFKIWVIASHDSILDFEPFEGGKDDAEDGKESDEESDEENGGQDGNDDNGGEDRDLGDGVHVVESNLGDDIDEDEEEEGEEEEGEEVHNLV